MKTKAAILHQTDAPLVIDEVSLTPPGRGEVLVELAAAGLCHSDLSIINGSLPHPLPVVLGHEASGVVLETGPDVTDIAPGDHVVFSFVPTCGRCLPCVSGRGALCERGAAANAAGTLLSGARHLKTDGGACHHFLGVSAFAGVAVAAQESLVKIDKSVPLTDAALFGCAVVTGVGAVVNTARVEAGASVVVFGLGGVGLSAVMGLKAVGAHPIVAVDRLEDKLRLGLELGATHTVNAAQVDAIEAVRDLTEGGAAYAFESVGNEHVMVQAYEATRRGGTTVSIGLPHYSRRFSVPALSIAAEERTIKGSFMGSSVPRRDIPRYISMYQAGLLPVNKLHTHTLTLDDINAGFDRLARAQAVRQLVTFA